MSKGRRIAIRVGVILVPLLLVTAWEVVVRAQLVPPSQAAAPSEVLARLGRLLVSGVLPNHGLHSLSRLLAGVAIGVIAGILSSMYLAKSRIADRLFSPTVQLLAGVPVVVWIPFWVMFFGTGEAFKISMVAISTFFLVHFHSFVALRAVERDYMELADIYEKSYWEKVHDVLLPSSAPAMLTATRTALAFGWVVIFFVEYASARQGSEGLGWFIADARAVGKVEEEFAGLLFLAVLAFVADWLLAKLQRRLIRWSDSLEGMVTQEGL
jgi:sulfonate transport system permease protein